MKEKKKMRKKRNQVSRHLFTVAERSPNATITMGTIKNMVGAHDLVLHIHPSDTARYPIHSSPLQKTSQQKSYV